MVNYQPCEKCKAEGLEILVDTIEKKDKSGTYMKNLDGSYHVQPFEQPNGEKTKWFHVQSKEHALWTKVHNGPSGFLQPKTQTTLPTGTASGPPLVIEGNKFESRNQPTDVKLELSETDKGLIIMYKEKTRGVMLLEIAVREVLAEKGNNNPDPRHVGLIMKLVGELG